MNRFYYLILVLSLHLTFTSTADAATSSQDLMEQLHDLDPRARARAQELLAQLGPSVLPSLFSLLKNGTDPETAHAISRVARRIFWQSVAGYSGLSFTDVGEPGQVCITSVTEGSPAWEAGMRVNGDGLAPIGIDGKSLAETNLSSVELQSVIVAKGAGKPFKISYVELAKHDDAPLSTITITLGSLPKEEASQIMSDGRDSPLHPLYLDWWNEQLKAAGMNEAPGSNKNFP